MFLCTNVSICEYLCTFMCLSGTDVNLSPVLVRCHLHIQLLELNVICSVCLSVLFLSFPFIVRAVITL